MDIDEIVLKALIQGSAHCDKLLCSMIVPWSIGSYLMYKKMYALHGGPSDLG
jgi:membrane protein CcdC involved in cytochrome C biogenesis